MKVYGIVITCGECDSQAIDYTEESQEVLTARNGRDSWSHSRYTCTCKDCGHQFEEIFSLQRASINL